MSHSHDNTAQCLVCEQGNDRVPLIAFQYQGQQLWICPQHLPILIHKPAELVGRLPGADRFSPAES